MSFSSTLAQRNGSAITVSSTLGGVGVEFFTCSVQSIEASAARRLRSPSTASSSE